MKFSNMSGWHDFAVIGNTSDYLHEGKRKAVGFSIHYYFPKREKDLSNSGYRLQIHEHTHPLFPNGSIADWPSGYYKSGEVDFGEFRGDANFARQMKANKSFTTPDTKFYIRPQGTNYKVEYDGYKPYKHVK